MMVTWCHWGQRGEMTRHQEQRRELERAVSEMSQRFDARQKMKNIWPIAWWQYVSCYAVFRSRVIGWSDPWHIMEVATEITSHHLLVANYRIIGSRQPGLFFVNNWNEEATNKKNVCKNVRPPITKVHHQIIAQYLMVDGWYPVRLQCEKSKTRNKKKSMSEVPYLFGHRGFKVWDAWLYIGSRAALCLEIWPQSGAEDMNNKTNLREGG